MTPSVSFSFVIDGRYCEQRRRNNIDNCLCLVKNQYEIRKRPICIYSTPTFYASNTHIILVEPVEPQLVAMINTCMTLTLIKNARYFIYGVTKIFTVACAGKCAGSGL